MKGHFDHLARLVPGLPSLNILDLGSGRGKFLVEAAKRGASVTGLEPYGPYREETKQRAADENLSVHVEAGTAEAMPFPNETFGFANASEVIEHVEDPGKMLDELSRVLQGGASAYISVPNRFGFKDQHFHLYLVNWLPRALSDMFIGIFGTHKDYQAKGNGRQRLADMHYYTYQDAVSLIKEHGFLVEDIRKMRIGGMPFWKKIPMTALYPLARDCYFDSFHLLLKKPTGFSAVKQVR